MKFVNEKVSDIQIAYIRGGSMYWVKNLIADLTLDGQLLGTIRLYDLDYGKAKIRKSWGNSVSDYAETNSRWTYKAYPTLQEALSGCDFVFIQSCPVHSGRWSPIAEHEKYGIYQAVGDTTGPGGLVRALRTIPMYAIGSDHKRGEGWLMQSPYTSCGSGPLEFSVEAGKMYEIFVNNHLRFSRTGSLFATAIP